MNTTHVTDHFTCDNHRHETSTCKRQCYIISGADAGFLKGGYRSPRKRGGGVEPQKYLLPKKLQAPF